MTDEIAAEFGQATGGIFQAVTKSGGNQFRVSGFVFTAPEAFRGDLRQTVLPNGTRGDEEVRRQMGTADLVSLRTARRDIRGIFTNCGA